MKKMLLITGILTLLLLLPVTSSQTTESTTIEIININGGVGGVTVDVKNTGDNIATDIWVITTVTGGTLNNININHECTGCSACGSTLDPGLIKSENTREAGILFGFGPIEISTSAGASNAETVSMKHTGFVFGPIAIIQ
jgi:hypothetical protein